MDRLRRITADMKSDDDAPPGFYKIPSAADVLWMMREIRRLRVGLMNVRKITGTWASVFNDLGQLDAFAGICAAIDEAIEPSKTRKG